LNNTSRRIHNCCFFRLVSTHDRILLSFFRVSPFAAILWCFYPVAILVLVELLLGGGFDDDNNDDQDGGMLIPAYSRSDV